MTGLDYISNKGFEKEIIGCRKSLEGLIMQS
jgi:hypothetical protein